MTSHFKFRWLAAIWLAVSLLAGAGASPASAQTCPAAPNEGDSVALNLDARGPNIAGCASGGGTSRGVVVTNNLASNTVKVALVLTGNNGGASCSGRGCTSSFYALAPSAQIACDTSLGDCAIFIQDAYSQGTLSMSFEVAQYSTSLPSIGFSAAGITPPQPNITSLSPNSFYTGTPVVITGANFTGAYAVNFGSTPATSFRVDSDTQITAFAPSNNSFSFSQFIRISTLGGSSNAFSYAVAGQGLVFPQPADQPFVLNGTFFVSAGGGFGTGPVAFTSKTAPVCSIGAYGIVTMLAPGTCTITATQGDTGLSQSVTQSLNLLIAQTITTFTPPPATDFSAGSVTLQASASSGLAVQFTSATPKVCTSDGSPSVTLVDAGVCQITASQPGNAIYLAATPVMRDFTINAIPQTVSFNGKPLADVPLASTKSVPLPTATGSPTGNPVKITASTTTVCVIDSSGLNLTILSAGKCTIMAAQAGGPGYASASATQSFNVTNTAQLVEFTMPVKDQLTTAPVGSITLAVKVTPAPPSGTNVVFAALTQTGFPTVCTVSGNNVTIVGTGQCTLTATVPGYVASNGNQYDIGTATQTFNVSAAPQTLVFDPIKDQDYSNASVSLKASGAAVGNTVTYTSNTPKVCTVPVSIPPATTATIVGVGTCAISATAPAYQATGTGPNPQYAAGNAVATFNVKPLPQTIAFANTATTIPFTDTPLQLTLTSDSVVASGSAVVFTSITPSVCTVPVATLPTLPATTAKLVGAGTCILTATAPAYPATVPANPPTPFPQYAVGTAKNYTFTVTKQPQTLAFSPVKPSDQVYPGKPVTFTLTGAASGSPATIASTTPAVCTVTPTTATIVGAGLCTLTATSPAYQDAKGTYYDVGAATLSFNVAKAQQTISFASPGNQMYGSGKSIALTTTSAPTVVGTTGRITLSSATTSACIVSGTTATIVGGGTCAITASLAESANYAAAADVTVSFTISNAPQTISFANPGQQSFVAGGTVALTVAGGGSTQSVQLASNTSSVCTVTNGVKPTATIVGSGKCTITASQAGDTGASPIYLAATPVTQSFLIAGSAQTITFTNPGNPVPPTFSFGATVTLTATTNSVPANVVTFSSSTPLVCTVAANATMAVMVSAGTCTIKASQAGSGQFAPAADVVLSFVIKAPVQSGTTPQTITFASPGSQSYSANGPISLVATGGASNNPVTFVSNPGSVCTVASGASMAFTTGVGPCSITASQAGNTTYAPAAKVTQSFFIAKGVQTIVFTQPATQTFSVGGPVALMATGGASGNRVVFASTTPAICTASGTTAKMVAAGTCTIVASQAGNANYVAATNVTQSFAINAAPVKPIAKHSVAATVRLSAASPVIAPVVVAPLTTTTTTTVTAGFNGDTVQQTTRSAIQNSVGQRANMLASSESDSARMHSRLSGGTLFGEAVDDASKPEGPATSIAASVAQRGGAFGQTGGAYAGTSSGLGPDFGYEGAAGSGSAGGGFGGIDRFARWQSGGFGKGTGSGSSEGSGFGMPFGMQRDYGFDDRERRSSASPFNFSGSADPSTGQFSFSTSLSQMRAANEAAEAQKRASLTAKSNAPFGIAQDAGNATDGVAPSGVGLSSGTPGPRSASRASAFDVWMDGNSSYFRNDSVEGRNQGQTTVMHTGADYVLRPGLLIGVMAQMDWTSQATSALVQNSGGLGWMAGPYISARLTPNLYLDARAAWGESTNQINAFGAFTDTYSTSRTLASAKLTGDWSWHDFRFRPSAEVVYFTELQKAYTNALGIDIGEQPVALGRTAVGPEIGYRMRLDGNSTLEPFVGFKGIWDFNATQDTTATGTPIGHDGLRGRVEGGFNWSTPSGVTIRSAGSYDGIGGGSYHAVQGQATVVVPFQ